MMYTRGNTKGITMKLNEVGENKDITVMIYEMPKFEDKTVLKALFNSLLDNMKVGEVIQAWKFFDTACSFKMIKKVNDGMYHFKAC